MPEIQKAHVTEGEHDCHHFQEGWIWTWHAGNFGGTPTLVMVCSECGENCAALPMTLLRDVPLPFISDIKPEVLKENFTRYD